MTVRGPTTVLNVRAGADARRFFSLLKTGRPSRPALSYPPAISQVLSSSNQKEINFKAYL